MPRRTFLPLPPSISGDISGRRLFRRPCVSPQAPRRGVANFVVGRLLAGVCGSARGTREAGRHRRGPDATRNRCTTSSNGVDVDVRRREGCVAAVQHRQSLRSRRQCQSSRSWYGCTARPRLRRQLGRRSPHRCPLLQRALHRLSPPPGTCPHRARSSSSPPPLIAPARPGAPPPPQPPPEAAGKSPSLRDMDQ